jgi:hypothetical protein
VSVSPPTWRTSGQFARSELAGPHRGCVYLRNIGRSGTESGHYRLFRHGDSTYLTVSQHDHAAHPRTHSALRSTGLRRFESRRHWSPMGRRPDWWTGYSACPLTFLTGDGAEPRAGSKTPLRPSGLRCATSACVPARFLSLDDAGYQRETSICGHRTYLADRKSFRLNSRISLRSHYGTSASCMTMSLFTLTTKIQKGISCPPL